MPSPPRFSPGGRRAATRTTAATPGLAGALLAMALLAGCGSDPEQPPPPDPRPTPTIPEGQRSTFTLVCATPIGEISNPLTLSVSQDPEAVRSGDDVTYSIAAPFEPADLPISATFLSSEVHFPIPDGLDVASAATEPPDPRPFTSVTTTVESDAIVVRSEGEFAVEERVEPSALVVTAEVTGDEGTTIEWRTPTLIRSTVRAPLVGEVTTDCEVEEPGVIAVTEVG